MKKQVDFLSGLPMTMLGGVFLLLSFVLPRVGIALPIDPAWITVIVSGIPLLYLAVWRILHNPGISKISSALLITIAMFAAIAIGDLFAAGEVAWIMAIGAILEDMTTNRARKGLKKWIHLAPTQGRRIRGGEEELVSPEQIQTGDILRILPGETVPVDGVIIRGETSVDQSVLTGESLPLDKGPGEEVFCGTINRFGSIDIQATKVGEDSSLQKLIRMVQEAEKKQAPMQRIADKGVMLAYITLHVGLGTFRPVKADEITEHHMHSELCMLSQETADLLNATRQRGGRIVCVGTTSCRTLESLVGEDGSFCPGSKWTDIFIYPGYRFRAMDALITNFHLPESTLVMLVSAFAGREHVLTAYREAVRERYRFFSFGDAMFIANEA